MLSRRSSARTLAASVKSVFGAPLPFPESALRRFLLSRFLPVRDRSPKAFFGPSALVWSSLLIVLSHLISTGAQAAFPDRPVRIVVPFSPGGGTDLIARTLGVTMASELGQPVVIDNKPGAGTIIGTDAVAKSAPDGYTLLIATFAHAVNPSLSARLPFATDKAFAPVMLIGRSPNVLVVRADSPFKSAREVLDTARAMPGKLTFASQGNGTSAHLAGELFKTIGRVAMTHIAYRGAGPALSDLLGGQVDMMFATSSAVGAMIDAGKLRALGVTTGERSAAMKNIPSLAEAGLPGYVMESWYGLYVPAGTPAEIIARLNAAARKSAHSELFRKRVEEEGLVISAGTPAELDAYVQGEEKRWRKIIKDNHIHAD